MDSGKAGTDRCPPKRTLEQVGVVILSLSAQTPLGALLSLAQGEVTWGYPVLAFWESLRLQTVLPSRVLPLSVSAQTGPRGYSKALSESPPSKARSSALSLAWQFSVLPMQCSLVPPLLLPLVFPVPSFREFPTKCSLVLLHKFVTPAWKRWLLPHLSSNVSSSGKSSLIYLSRSNTPSVSMPQRVWILALVAHFVV